MAIKLNVGCGRNILPEWTNLDVAASPGVDIVYDLERAAEIRLPLEENTVDEFLLSHVLEHVSNALPMMQELYRVARPDAKAIIRLPHGASDDAWEDPTHVRSYFPQSFSYFAQTNYWRADYGYRGDWQPERVLLLVSKQIYAGVDADAISKDLMSKRNVVLEMIAEMRAVKPIREPLRELQIPPKLEIVLV